MSSSGFGSNRDHACRTGLGTLSDDEPGATLSLAFSRFSACLELVFSKAR